MKRGLPGLRVVSLESRRSAEVAELILAGLRQWGAQVATVPVYGWALPEDTAPMRAVIERLVAGAVDAVPAAPRRSTTSSTWHRRSGGGCAAGSAPKANGATVLLERK